MRLEIKHIMSDNRWVLDDDGKVMSILNPVPLSIVSPFKGFNLTDSDLEGFYGQHTSFHENGWLVTTFIPHKHPTSNHEEKLIIYRRTKTDNWICHQIIELGNQHVCQLEFAPAVNQTKLDVLIVSVAVNSSGAFEPATPSQVNIYVCQSDSSEPDWILRKQVKHPFYTWQPNTPYKGTFGDKIKIVKTNLNGWVENWHVYIRGSQYMESEPSGCIFWYCIDHSDSSSDGGITMKLLQQIKDKKLYLLSSQGKVSYTNPSDVEQVIGFGYDFDVSMSGSTISRNDGILGYLAVSNISTNDSDVPDGVTTQTDGVHGYVQIFVLKYVGIKLLWEQEELDFTPGHYLYRYPANNAWPEGFGSSLRIYNNSKLIVGTKFSCKYYVFDISERPKSNTASHVLEYDKMIDLDAYLTKSTDVQLLGFRYGEKIDFFSSLNDGNDIYMVVNTFMWIDFFDHRKCIGIFNCSTGNSLFDVVEPVDIGILNSYNSRYMLNSQTLLNFGMAFSSHSVFPNYVGYGHGLQIFTNLDKTKVCVLFNDPFYQTETSIQHDSNAPIYENKGRLLQFKCTFS
jgi:hypothetical protein